MRTHELKSALLVSLCAALPVKAQDVALGIPAVQTTEAGGVVVDGPTYRCRIAPDHRVVFEPALGRHSSSVARFVFRTASIARATGPDVAPLASLPLRETPDGIVLPVGDGVEERWTPRRAGMEVSWLLAHPLPGSGDLEIRMALETGPFTQATPHGSALRFADPDRPGTGGLHLGAVTVLDARGATAAGALQYDASRGQLVVRVAAAAVDSAVYPLCIDPLVGADFPVGSSSDPGDNRPDAAWLPGAQEYLVVWERAFSLTDGDVLGQRVDAQGNPVGSLLVLADPPGLATAPTVASNATRDRWLVSWLQRDSLLGADSIAARAVAPASGALGPATAVPSGNGLVTELVSTHELGSSDAGHLLVFRRDDALQATRVGLPAALSSPLTTSPAPTPIPIGPLGWKLSRAARADGRHLLWAYGAFGSNQVIGITPGLTFTPLLQLPTAIAPATDVELRNATTWDVVRLDSTTVQCVPVQWQRNGTLAHDPVIIRNLPQAPRTGVDFARLGPKRLALWSVPGSNLLEYQLGGAALARTDCSRCSPEFQVPLAGRTHTAAVIASQQDGSDDALDDEALLVYVSADRLPPFGREIRAVRYAAFGAGGTMTSLGGGCGPIALTPGQTGDWAIGNPSQEVFTDGVSGGSAAFFVVGLPGQFTPCGPCEVVQWLAVLPGTIVGNRASSPLPLSCDPGFDGVAVDTQWIAFGLGSVCPLAPLAVSERQRVVFGF